MTHDHCREDLAFEQLDARLGWWEALFFGLSIGVVLGAALAWWSM